MFVQTKRQGTLASAPLNYTPLNSTGKLNTAWGVKATVSVSGYASAGPVIGLLNTQALNTRVLGGFYRQSSFLVKISNSPLGVSATAAAGSVSITRALGTAATAAVGAFSVRESSPVLGASISGICGVLTESESRLLSGVLTSSSAGSVSPSGKSVLLGSSSSGVAGSLVASVSPSRITVSGAAASALPGSVVLSVSGRISGVATSALAGQISATDLANPAGASASAVVASPGIFTQWALSGAASSVSVFSCVSDPSVTLQGSSALGVVAAFSAVGKSSGALNSSALNFQVLNGLSTDDGLQVLVATSLTGVSATAVALPPLIPTPSVAAYGIAGVVVPDPGSVPGSATASAQAGQVSKSLAFGFSGVSASVTAGSVVGSAQISLPGVSGLVSCGSVFGSLRQALSGVATLVSAGSVSCMTAVSMAGAAASASAGQISATDLANPAGASASAVVASPGIFTQWALSGAASSVSVFSCVSDPSVTLQGSSALGVVAAFSAVGKSSGALNSSALNFQVLNGLSTDDGLQVLVATSLTGVSGLVVVSAAAAKDWSQALGAAAAATADRVSPAASELTAGCFGTAVASALVGSTSPVLQGSSSTALFGSVAPSASGLLPGTVATGATGAVSSGLGITVSGAAVSALPGSVVLSVSGCVSGVVASALAQPGSCWVSRVVSGVSATVSVSSSTSSAIGLLSGVSSSATPANLEVRLMLSINGAVALSGQGWVIVPPSSAPGEVSSFPPSEPTTLQKVLPSYLYQQYADDDDLQAFVEVYNGMAQTMLSWFNTVNLPVYTQLQGALLDWVTQGLYGIQRPTLISGQTKDVGTLGTVLLNTKPLDAFAEIGPQNYFVTDDDVFKRIVTWRFYKGDGKHFNIKWLKRRIMRFLQGENGSAPNIDETYRVSMSFGADGQVNISLIRGRRTVARGTLGSYVLGSPSGARLGSLPLNGVASTYVAYEAFAKAPQLQAAIQTGSVELPFQYTYVVSI